jgi:hypothetical protein
VEQSVNDPTFADPGGVMVRLAQIEQDMALRQNNYEAAARAWVMALRDQKRARAIAFLNAEGTVAERQAIADRDTALDGKMEEAEFEALKAVMRTLSERASVGQSILRAQGRT